MAQVKNTEGDNMSGGCYTREEIKKKIRKLKKTEIKIRFGNAAFSENGLSGTAKNAKLIWDEFFNLSENYTGHARYSLGELISMGKDELKEVISEFFFKVYYTYYRENGFVNISMYDPEILRQFGLPYDADINAVKKRFRELAKKYHPDAGGDSAKFIELMENYKKLIK